jgi:hypothetical protein
VAAGGPSRPMGRRKPLRWRLAAIYCLLGVPQRRIASLLGYTYGSVRHVLARPEVRAEVYQALEMAKERAGQAYLPRPAGGRPCRLCSRPIPPWRRQGALYCSEDCRRRAQKGRKWP